MRERTIIGSEFTVTLKMIHNKCYRLFSDRKKVDEVSYQYDRTKSKQWNRMKQLIWFHSLVNDELRFLNYENDNQH